MKIFRIIALAVILLAAVVTAIVTITAKPTDTASSSVSAANMSTENYSSLVRAALTDYDANAATTDNVYQQQVVAAWAAKDLLSVIGQQNATIIDNQVAAADAQSDAQAAIIDNQATALAAQQHTQGLISGVMVVGVLLLAALVVIGLTLVDRRPAAAPSQSSLAPSLDSGTPAATPSGPATSDAGEQGDIA